MIRLLGTQWQPQMSMCIEPCGGRPVMEEEKPDEECNDPLGCEPDEGRF